MQIQNLHYVVDIDIKGFFDNVCHGKLIRQMWELGIRDKTLLCIIKSMLKAQIVLPNGDRVNPEKGTPQGGILSPLLSNIVLNELDWWIASQWEEMPTHYPYQQRFNKAGTEIKSHTYRALRGSKLKEMHIVRYADDFKIFCRSHADAVNTFIAVKQWLKDRLKLDINEEKSAVINLKRRYSDYLGFKLKVCENGGKFKVESHMSDKAKAKAKKKISECVTAMKNPESDKGQYKAIQRYNATVAGMHNYYQYATHVSIDFSEIAYGVKKQLSSRLKELTRNGKLERGFIKEKYGRSKELRFLNGQALIPVAYVRTKDAMHKKKSVNRYTAEGREEIHKDLGINTATMLWLMKNPVGSRSIAYADNRISLYAAQYGKCAVTGKELSPHEIHCHHKIPLHKGGTDDYANLVIVSVTAHTLIHATQTATIGKYLTELQLTKAQLTKLNKLRKLADNSAI
jgi:group II intron reverse transcriptase/maturase